MRMLVMLWAAKYSNNFKKFISCSSLAGEFIILFKLQWVKTLDNTCCSLEITFAFTAILKYVLGKDFKTTHCKSRRIMTDA